jgi:hypothetical protein
LRRPDAFAEVSRAFCRRVSAASTAAAARTSPARAFSICALACSTCFARRSATFVFDASWSAPSAKFFPNLLPAVEASRSASSVRASTVT